LVVADRGHPATPGADGTVVDATTGPVEVPTTLLVTKNLPRSVADTSGRFVYGEFRVVEVDVTNVATEADHELATEIVLRTSLW
ncbi:alpha/beta hydrolase, partial [Nocardia beijingensis]